MTTPAPLLVVIGSLDIGGTERHLAQVLPELARRGRDIEVATLTHRGVLAPRLEAAGIAVHAPRPLAAARRWPRLARRLVALPAAILALARHMGRDRRRIVHFFLPESYLVGMLVAGWTRSGPLVMSRRSLNRYQRRYPLVAAWERHLHRRVDRILVNSAAVRQQLCGEEGVPGDRVTLIYNGIDLDACEPGRDRGAVRAELGIPDSAWVMTIVANLIPYKGHADLLAALAAVTGQLPDPWRLLVVGRDAGIGEALRESATRLGLAGSILWLGERLDVPELLGASDAGVLTSHEEGFSNAILECMAAGLPVVVTDVGGNAEAVLDGKTGRVVPAAQPRRLGAALAEIAGDRAKAIAWGNAGRDRVRARFSLGACVDAYERMYADLDATASHPDARPGALQ